MKIEKAIAIYALKGTEWLTGLERKISPTIQSAGEFFVYTSDKSNKCLIELILSVMSGKVK